MPTKPAPTIGKVACQWCGTAGELKENASGRGFLHCRHCETKHQLGYKITQEIKEKLQNDEIKQQSRNISSNTTGQQQPAEAETGNIQQPKSGTEQPAKRKRNYHKIISWD